MPSLNETFTDSQLSFWIIALPVMAVVIPLATWRDILGIIHYVQKKVLAKNAVKVRRLVSWVEFFSHIWTISQAYKRD